MPKRFLLATWEGGGNLTPELSIAKKLIARGHSVRVIADPTVEGVARAAGCGFAPWSRAPHRLDLDPSNDPLHDWTFGNPLKGFAYAVDNYFCGPAAQFAADTLEELDENPADVVLTDMIMFGAMIAAESRGIPHASLVPNIYLRPAPGLPPIGLGFAKAAGPLGRLRDRLMGFIGNRVWRRGLAPMNRARKGLGLAPLETTFEQYDHADAVYVLTSQSFDFKADALPPNVRYLGAQLDDPSWVAPWTSPWAADDQRPLVLVSLSSTFQDQLAVLRRIVVAAETLDARVLVTTGPAIAPRDVPVTSKNVVLVQSAPHAQVLKEAALCVSHCGHGTTIRALAHGVPLVCIPMGRDQNDTAARVVHRNAGVRLTPGASVEKLRTTIRVALANPTLREGARSLASAIAEDVRSIDAGAEVEALAKDRPLARGAARAA